MTLAELIQEVYTLTNRPDLVAQTLTAVRSATLKIHQLDYFYKDLFETGIQFSSAEYVQHLDYRTLIPLWRTFKYLRKSNSAAFDDGPFFTVLSITEMVEDTYNLNQNDVCYTGGALLQIRSSTLLQYAFLGCYVNPNITPGGYNSWLALDHPYSIIYEAAATVFKMVGDTDQFAAYTRLAQEEAQLVRISNIQAIGY